MAITPGFPHRASAETLAALFAEVARLHADRPAFATRGSDGIHTPVNYRELYERSLALATGLLELGIQPGDKVALFSDNRLEWMLCDCALLSIGAVDVPRGTDITESEVRHILSHSDAVAVFVENRAVLERVVRQQAAYPAIRHIIALDRNTASPPGNPHLQELIERGAAARAAGDRRVEAHRDEVKPAQLATLIYTSGTTGTPKGVMLTHANIASQIRSLPIDIQAHDRLLSILPIWHAYERVVEYASMAGGACTYYTSIRAIGEDLKRVRPTFMASAPRLWESLHQRILNGVRSAPAPRRAVFNSAVACARWFRGSLAFLSGNALDLEGRTPWHTVLLATGHTLRLLATAVPFFLLDAAVVSKVRAALGGCLRGTISGGGALPLHIDEFFNHAGMPVLEGYGLTETSPVLAVRLPGRVVIGTVGPPYPGTDIRIHDLNTQALLWPAPERASGGLGLRGEIHVRGPQVMPGYYKQPEATAAVLKEGWFNTGDIGIMTHNGCLRIVGRSKETIVLTSGENVEPGPIEAKLTSSPLILQAVVLGQDAKQLSALIVPNLEGFKAAGVACATLAELVAHPRFTSLMEAEISRIVSRQTGFKSFELVQDWRALTKPFEVGDELTATYKLRRHVISAKYGAQQ